MHSEQPVASESPLSHHVPTIGSPNIHMVELHPASPHSAQLSDIDDETEHEITRNSYLPTSKSCKSRKYKSKSLKTKTKTTSKSRPKYNTLHIDKAENNSQDTANSSSSSNEHMAPIKKSSDSLQFEPGYKEWKGSNSIFCSGRIIAGPETAKQIRTFFMIIIPMAIYFATTALILWSEYNMSWVVIICIFILIICILFFFIVSCIDPGIIPRPLPYEKCFESTDVANSISTEFVSPPWEQRINVDGNIRTLKWCYTCHHFRGPRSFHCANCNVCIERFDHHCPWLGNCIAARNYHFYVLFLLSINAMCIWVGWSSIYVILKRSESKYAPLAPTETFLSLWKYDTWPMITLCFAVIGLLFPFILLSFHCYLIATGQTTNEKAKHAFDFVSPYSRGCLGNILELCCIITSIPQSNVHIRHQPPNKTENEAIVNKRKIVYISSEDTKQTISQNLNSNKTNTNNQRGEKQKLLPQNRKKRRKKRRDRHQKNGIIEEEEEKEEVHMNGEEEKDELIDSQNNDSSMDNNDPTPSSNEESHPNPMHIERHHSSQDAVATVDHLHPNHAQLDRTHSAYDYNIKRANKNKRVKVIHHENIGSNSSLDDQPHSTYTTNLNSGGSRLKRKRHNNKLSRSHSGYSATYKLHKKRANRYVMDSRSNPSLRHHHSTEEQPQPRSIHSEQVYLPQNESGTTYIDPTNSGATASYHPAYHKYMRKLTHNHHANEFAFSPLSPVDSKDNNGTVAPHYPSPINYHNNNNTATPILSINEDNHTLTSTYSFGNNTAHMHHAAAHKKHLHHQYKGTNSHNTLFSPDISSGAAYLDNEATNTSSSDYYTTITAPSHAQTYHHHPQRNNHHHHHNHHHNANPFGANNITHHEYSQPQHRYSPHKRGGAKMHKTPKYNYNVNDILELSTSNRHNKNYWPNRADRYMD